MIQVTLDGEFGGVLGLGQTKDARQDGMELRVAGLQMFEVRSPLLRFKDIYSLLNIFYLFILEFCVLRPRINTILHWRYDTGDT